MLYPKDQKPRTPLELHVRLALFVVGLTTECHLSQKSTPLSVDYTDHPDHHCGFDYLIKNRMVAKEVVSPS